MMVPISLSINMDMVLKCKFGVLIQTDFSIFKQFNFPSTRLSFNSRVLTLSRDIGHEAHLFGRKFDIIYFYHKHTLFDILDTSAFLYFRFRVLLRVI